MGSCLQSFVRFTEGHPDHDCISLRSNSKIPQQIDRVTVASRYAAKEEEAGYAIRTE